MIPVLYGKAETDFTHNGQGVLIDTVKAVVTEERHGEYELSLQYPITGKWCNLIGKGSIIKAKANDTSDLQLFRVYKISKPIKGIVTISANHISYDLHGFPLAGFTVENVTAQEAIEHALESSPISNRFSAYSDIDTVNSTEIITPCSIRALLAGQRGSILDTWGGEYEFDNFVIKLHAHRGADNGVTIDYGKNLTELTHETETSDCYTHLLPYASYTVGESESDPVAREGEHIVLLTEQILPIPGAENMGVTRVLIKDFSEDFGNEMPTETALRNKATAFIASTNTGKPRVNITVSFIPLWQTEEYKSIAPLERVSLCDTVKVRYTKLGVTASAKVVKTVYNALLERYEKITLGDIKETLADLMLYRFDGERARINAERARVYAEAGRVTAEQGRVTAEQGRVTAEQGRVTAEQGRVSAETSRVSAEQDREDAETARKTAEAGRVTAEQGRVTAETSRVTAEQGRVSAETSRVSAEQDREDAETARKTAEQGRVTAEQGRVTAEAARAAAEATRNADEIDRKNAEIARSAKFTQLMNWESISTVELDAASDTITVNLSSNYDELRITAIGTMSGGNSARVYINGQTDYIRFEVFLGGTGNNTVSVFDFQKPRLGYVFAEFAASGAALSRVADTGVFMNVASINIQKYSSITISGTAESTTFNAGTRFVIEGRKY